MSEKVKKSSSLSARICAYAVLGSVTFVVHQLLKVYSKINKATSTDVLSIDRFQPTYIYIEDPFLQEEIEAGVTLSREKLKLTRFHKWLYDKIEGSFVFRNYFSYKKSLPWRYLRLAKDEQQSLRVRAVRSLAAIDNLTDAEFQQLAQVCDMRTAVGLARSTENLKFLLDPPYFKSKPDKNAIVKNFNELLVALDASANHPCLSNFVSKVFSDLTDAASKGPEDYFRFKYDSREFITMCLEALLHHSWTDNYARQIVKLGGLPLLTEVYKYLNEFKEVEPLIVLSKLMANISTCDDCAHNIFTSGWIKLLSELSQHKDIRISAPAQKALSNLDEDDPSMAGGLKFWRRIYPLYPNQRTLAEPKLDVIFIHGLLGGVFITWRQRDHGHCSHKSPLELLGFTASDEERERVASYHPMKPLDQEFFVDVRDLPSWEKIAGSYEFVLADIPVDSNLDDSTGPFYASRKEGDCPENGFSKCWPRDWLTIDCPEIRLIGVDYETNISKWTPMCPYIIMGKGSLNERSNHLMKILSQAGVGKRPIVWVGHSMGGLIVKGMLTLARKSSDPALRLLFEQTKAIVFYSTPHKGSHLAALNPTSQMIVWPSVEVQELRENSPGLLELHEEFLHLVKEYPFKVITFAERESTFITSLKFELRFVNASSADPDVGEHYGIPLDHLSICKPSGKQSFIYQRVKKLIKEIIKEVDRKRS